MPKPKLPNPTADCPVKLSSNGAYWMARWYDSAGKRRSKSLGPKSEVSRRHALDECQSLAVRFVIQPARRDQRAAPTLSAWRERWMNVHAPGAGLEAASAADIDSTLGLMIECPHLGGELALHKLSTAKAADFRAWLMTTPMPPRGKKPKDGRPGWKDRRRAAIVSRLRSESTVRKHIRNAKTIFEQAVREGVLVSNPFEGLPSSVPKIAKDFPIIDAAALERILANCPPGDLGTDWRTLIGLCRLAGMRLREALRLKITDINMESRVLAMVPPPEKKKVTTKSRERMTPIQPRLATLLAEAIEAAPTGAVYVIQMKRLRAAAGGWPTMKRALWQQMRAITLAAGVPPYPKPFHMLRKNLASELKARFPKAAVHDWLGHSEDVQAKFYFDAPKDLIQQMTREENPVAELERARVEVDRLRRELAEQRTPHPGRVSERKEKP